MPFHAVVVFTLGYDLFKSILGNCGKENVNLRAAVIQSFLGKNYD